MIKTSHEPNAQVMSAAEVWDDTLQLAALLRENMLKAEPMVRLRIPLSLFLSALDSLNRDELEVLRRRVRQRLAA